MQVIQALLLLKWWLLCSLCLTANDRSKVTKAAEMVRHRSHSNSSDAAPSVIRPVVHSWSISVSVTHTHTHLFKGLCLGLPGWAGTRKVKPVWILLKQETVSGSGISWDICQVCTSLQADNHASPSCRPTNSVKALKGMISVSVKGKKSVYRYGLKMTYTIHNYLKLHHLFQSHIQHITKEH